MKKIIIVSLLLFFALEVASFYNFLFFAQNPIFFILILLALLFASLYKLEYGLYFILGEIFIGGKGYLFSLNLENFSISLRIGFFIIIFSVWLVKKFLIPKSDFFKKIQIPGYHLLIPLFLMIMLGIIIGFLRNSFSSVFFDANSWLYFLLIYFFFDTVSKNNIEKIYGIFISSVMWIGVKTALMLFLFSRNFFIIGDQFYVWIRNTGIGEITSMGNGVYRIFFQSHIYSLLAVIIILSFLYSKAQFNKKISLLNGLALYFGMLSVLISQSRSFWVGGIMAFFIIIAVYWIKWRDQIIVSIIFPTLLIFMIIYSQFSLINLITGNFSNLFSERISNSQTEAASSSRLNQLKPLITGIKKNILFGSGFGTEIMYKSNDPRILKTNKGGLYATSAFEWGYLDIWLKIGIIGLTAYLAFIFYVAFSLIKKESLYSLPLFFGLIALIFSNIFTPYLNHPLGIGYILWLYGFSKNN